MQFPKILPQISQTIAQHQCFKGLLNERRVFPTPWHWCVHGLGIGQEATGFDRQKSDRLLEISLALSRKTNTSYNTFAYHLLNGILAKCEAVSFNSCLAQERSHDEFKKAIDQLPREPWQYARACALLTESLVKVGQLEPYRHLVRWHLERALEQVTKLDLSSDKLRYEKLQLFANLLLAVGHAEFTDLLVLQQENGDTYADKALQLAATISDVFYRGRGSAIIFSVLAIIGSREQVCTGRQNHLQTLLNIFDSELNDSLARDSDGVHEGADYYLFPLSLILNAIAVLDCPDYLTYKRDWVEQAVSLYHTLSPASQASQITFFIYALDNLGVLDVYVPDIVRFFHQCMKGYIQSIHDFRVDTYLRCTYLIHLACQLGCPDILHPSIWSIFSNNAAQIFGSKHYLKSNYGSSYMVAAYALSAFDRIGKLDMLFSSELTLPNAIGGFQDNPESTAINSPKTVFALIETGLRMRPIGSCDTPLFQKVCIDK
ncbi:MAG: hypothetical protein RMY28_013885 [Nostoc sp. ChiSLP01]|nr:hypothetical protein [Nostoc sp. CmiSLP01]MDZ8286508.1 hypothetical protein [Nostoc sp. ChiSLP01]